MTDIIPIVIQAAITIGAVGVFYGSIKTTLNFYEKHLTNIDNSIKVINEELGSVKERLSKIEGKLE